MLLPPQTDQDLRYPIGKFDLQADISPSQLELALQAIESLPQDLQNAVSGLSDAQLDTPYRPGGWTVRQVVHHLADSHLNAYIRFRLALTEDEPTIKPYNENAWAHLTDAEQAPLAPSLQILEGLHTRWVLLLRSLTQAQLHREFMHPENGLMRLDKSIGSYGWHSRHHLAHITRLRERMGW